MRTYTSFTYKDSKFRIASDRFDVVADSIKRDRTELEAYIKLQPEFKTSLVPVRLRETAPAIALEMARAGELAKVGPMASVAGAIAEAAAREAIRCGAMEAIVENGGDIFLFSKEEVTVGLFAGAGSLADSLAFIVAPSYMPCAICSSSGTMGHSLSLGECDLATIVSDSGALADAAATLAGNAVHSESDIGFALEQVMKVDGVRGALIVKGEKIGLAGDLPKLVRNRDKLLSEKVTRFPA
jgi:uncharacterized protein